MNASNARRRDMSVMIGTPKGAMTVTDPEEFMRGMTKEVRDSLTDWTSALLLVDTCPLLVGPDNSADLGRGLGMLAAGADED